MKHQQRTEYHEQVAVIEYLKCVYGDTLLTIAPNGIKLTIGQGAKFKRMGYVKGTPDLMIFEPRGRYHGLFIELKKEKGGQVSPEQRIFIERAIARGYHACVCKGFDDARRVIDWYFND